MNAALKLEMEQDEFHGHVEKRGREDIPLSNGQLNHGFEEQPIQHSRFSYNYGTYFVVMSTSPRWTNYFIIMYEIIFRCYPSYGDSGVHVVGDPYLGSSQPGADRYRSIHYKSHL
ncbi:hypothetical protein LIER_18333 [Lithospermum erythrorhizon]|uniref:Uncharacterized protein n=1 Tax=Lithospermum erythrorhizon TaxID=34254 RepID=A0AAV3QDL7_LITER